MDKVVFDKNGNLSPYELIEINLETFQSIFVENMENHEHRSLLFENYYNYTKELCNKVTNFFYQWINGSFVTKKFAPRDIDLVSFIDYRLVEKSQHELKNFVYPLSKENYNVDAYIVKVYPESENNVILSKSDTIYWFHHFQKTRPNKEGEKFYKGFIKIDLSHENI